MTKADISFLVLLMQMALILIKISPVQYQYLKEWLTYVYSLWILKPGCIEVRHLKSSFVVNTFWIFFKNTFLLILYGFHTVHPESWSHSSTYPFISFLCPWKLPHSFRDPMILTLGCVLPGYFIVHTHSCTCTLAQMHIHTHTLVHTQWLGSFGIEIVSIFPTTVRLR